MSPQKKPDKPTRRKTFSFPAEGIPMDDDLAFMGGGAAEPPMNGLPDAVSREQQIEMLESVLRFDLLAWRAFKLICASTLFFGLITSLTGWFLGLTCPGYFRFLFDSFDRVEFQPAIIGLGHGLLWGSIAGATIGGLVVLAVALYQSRTLRGVKRRVSE